MKYLKILVVVAALVAGARYFPVLYYNAQYKEYVGQASQKAKNVRQLRKDLVAQAEQYFLPVKPEDITILENGSAIKVDVNYHVPVNFFLFQHVLSFHAAGSGNGIAYELFGGS